MAEKMEKEQVEAPVPIVAEVVQPPPVEVEVEKKKSEEPPVKEEEGNNKTNEKREKKTKSLADAVLKEKKPKQPKTASHPPYFQMIKDALLALNENSGSSPYAIAKFMEEKHKAVLSANFRKTLALQLKNSAAKGKLIKIRASYKLSESGKKGKSATKTSTNAASARKPTSTTTTTKPKKPRTKTRSVNKQETGKKAAAGLKTKKPAPSAKVKQPRSIRSPAAKRAKKATAAA